MLASWRTKSSQSYESLFGKWARWCSERGRDPVSGPIADIANFLAYLHEEGYQSRSLNAYRSAISSVHDSVDGVEVGKHPMISRLLKGAYHVRPPLPQYAATWNVQVVLQYIEGLGPSGSLSLKLLTFKLVMLMALTRPSRSADLASLQLDRRRYKPEGVAFLPASLAKQSSQGRILKEFFSHPFYTIMSYVLWKLYDSMRDVQMSFDQRTPPSYLWRSRSLISQWPLVLLLDG